jgi:hypothetical protein
MLVMKNLKADRAIKGRIVLAALALAALAMPCAVLAQTPPPAIYACTGNVTGVSVNPAGSVILSTDAGFNSVGICQLGQTFNGATPEACKGVMAILIAAKLGNRPVTVYFNDGASGMTCTNHPSWDTLTGWYFGPVIN